MGALIGFGDPAGHLFGVLCRVAHEGEHRYRIVARLFLQQRIIDGAAINAWRGAGLQPSDRQLQFAQAMRQADRRRVAGATSLKICLPDMNQTGQESAGGQHHGFSTKAQTHLRDHPAYPVLFNQ